MSMELLNSKEASLINFRFYGIINYKYIYILNYKFLLVTFLDTLMFYDQFQSICINNIYNINLYKL